MDDSAAPISQTSPAEPAPRHGQVAAPITLMHSGISVGRYTALHVMGMIFPMTAGLLLFGWRALASMIVVAVSAAATLFVWRRIGSRGGQLGYAHGLWLAMLLAMTLPAHLFAGAEHTRAIILWPALAAGGVILVIFIWLLGGLGSGRVHPVLITYLLLFVCFKDLLVPHYVLQRSHVFTGDILRNTPTDISANIKQPWIRAPDVPPYHAIRTEPASQILLSYTSGVISQNRAWISLDALLRDRLPPLEDLIVGGHPAPIGSASAIALIIGGLFLLYRGVIDYRVPLIIFLTAAAAMIVLPVPVVIKENEAVWHWLAMRLPDVGWPLGLTLVSYELMAGPLVFTAFFLATSSAVRPISRRGRAIYAALIGLLTGVFQLYVSVAAGPYLALLTASLVAPALDKLFHPRTLV